MPDIIFTVSSPEKLQRLVGGICKRFNYQETVQQWDEVLQDHIEIPNPETQNQFAKRMVTKYLIRWVKTGELLVSREAEDGALDADLAANLEIT